ncbi:MAG: endonuclease III [Synergistaceae bacterium]|jgi:endonuclease-3|nr:endonuclease III [Synergistaceae bacterium]
MSRATGTKRTERNEPAKRASGAAPRQAPRGAASVSPSVLHPGSLNHILFVLRELEELYGFGLLPADEFATGEPLDGLMLTLLSQNTNDRNRDKAYETLRAGHPAWGEVAALSSSDITSLIRPAGLGGTKAARMKDILGRIFSDFGGYSLVAMLDWAPEDVRSYLSALPGIGPKTVACVMAFDLDMPAFPVDTHVARLSRRLGWAGEKASPERIQEFLEATVPYDLCRGGHLDMIEHGRKICRARKPECGECVISRVCGSFGLPAEKRAAAR